MRSQVSFLHSSAIDSLTHLHSDARRLTQCGQVDGTDGTPCICLAPACVVGTLHAFPTHTLLQGEAGGLDPRNIHCLRKRGRRPFAKTKVGHATCQSCCRFVWLNFILFPSTFLCRFTYVSPSSRLVRFSLWKPWLHAKQKQLVYACHRPPMPSVPSGIPVFARQRNHIMA